MLLGELFIKEAKLKEKISDLKVYLTRIEDLNAAECTAILKFLYDTII